MRALCGGIGFLVWECAPKKVGDRIEILMAAYDCLCPIDASVQVVQQQVSAVD